MGTKLIPGKFDCYNNALPNEPMFILLARDPSFNKLVHRWARERRYLILVGERPDSDFEMVNEATHCAEWGMNWRKDNFGIWRKS